MGSILKMAYDEYVKWYYPDPKKYWQKRKSIVDEALTRIRKERNNFRKIEDKNRLSSKGEFDAVMVKSFELLIEEIEPVAEYCSIRRLADRVPREAASQKQAQTKDVVRLIALIDKLEKKLTKDRCHQM